MDAHAKTVTAILRAGDQYLVPFFQRHYSWKQKHWKQLRNDLWALCEDGESSQHFLGPLVCTPMKIVPTELPKYQLIDGQQRLTTLTVLLAALRDVALENGNEALAEEIQEDFLLNKRKKDLQRYKVVPRLGDRDAFVAVVEGRDTEPFRHFGLVRAWQYYRREVRELLAKAPERLEALLRAVTGQLSLVGNRSHPGEQ
jgi:hypothetical protein